MRLEFASRGSIHVHWFAYLKDAPQYGKASNNEIASSDVKPEHHQFLEYQLHRHVKSCRIGNRQICKYGFLFHL